MALSEAIGAGVLDNLPMKDGILTKNQLLCQHLGAHSAAMKVMGKPPPGVPLGGEGFDDPNSFVNRVLDDVSTKHNGQKFTVSRKFLRAVVESFFAIDGVSKRGGGWSGMGNAQSYFLSQDVHSG